MVGTLFSAPKKTQHVGKITGITLTPVTQSPINVDRPIVASNAIDGTIVGVLAAQGAVGAVTWAQGGDDLRFRLSGNQVVVNDAGGDLVPGGSATIVVEATDTRGPGSFFSFSFTVDVYNVPTDIQLGPPAAILDTAPSGTVVGALSASTNLGVMALPITFTRQVNTDFTTGPVSGGIGIIRNTTGTLTGPGTANVTIRATDNFGLYVEEVFSINIQHVAPPPSGDSRFIALASPTPVISLVWRRPDGSSPLTSVWPNVLREGFAGDWAMYSVDCPLVHSPTTGVFYATVLDAKKDAVAKGYTTADYVFGTAANPYARQEPYQIEIEGFTQDINGKIEFLGVRGTGVIDMGIGPSGVKQWDLPATQLMVLGGAANTQLLDLSRLQATHGLSDFTIENLRIGPTREEEAGTTVTVTNIPGATTAAQTILPGQPRFGQGAALIETANRVRVSRVEQFGSFFQGIHTTKDLKRMRRNGWLQIFDSVFRSNGDSGLKHNIYAGDEKFIQVGYCHLTQPSGHNFKSDNAQRFELYKNLISGYHKPYIKYSRLGLKVFKGSSWKYSGTSTITGEAPLRTVPSVAPFRIPVYAYYDDTDTTVTPNVPLSPYYEVGGALITVLSSGSPGLGQCVRTYNGGVKNTDKNKHTQDAFFDFNPADAGKQVRIPCRGFTPSRIDTGGGGISIDNCNQDFAIWDNMCRGFHISGGSTYSFILIQGRFQGGDTRHRKIPDYSWQDDSVWTELQMVSEQGGTKLDGNGWPGGKEPNTFTASIISPVPASGTVYTLDYADFIYSAMFGDAVAPNTVLKVDGTIWDAEVRQSDGSIFPTTFTISSIITTRSSGSVKMTVNFAARPTGTITGNIATHENIIIFKKSVASGGSADWDAPLMTTSSQEDFFNRASPNYWAFLVTHVSDRAQLDLRKNEPEISGLKWGFPLGTIFHNFFKPLEAPDTVQKIVSANGLILTSYNTCFSTKLNSDEGYYVGRLWMPPQNSPQGAWAYNAAYGTPDWRLSTHPTTTLGGPLFAIEATDGAGVGGTDMPPHSNSVVMRENGVFHWHVPSNVKYTSYANVGDQTADLSLLNRADMYADIRVVSQNAGRTRDLNGCTRLTVDDKLTIPIECDIGLPAVVIGKYGSTGGSDAFAIWAGGGFGTRVDGCRIRMLAGGAPAVGLFVFLEADSQYDVGGLPFVSLLTQVDPVSGSPGDYDILFDPGLTKVGDDDPLTGGTVPLGHELGLMINTSPGVNGGNCLIVKPSIPNADVDAFWVLPTDISS